MSLQALALVFLKVGQLCLSFKDGDFDLHCTSFCTALYLFQYNSFKQHKMNELFRKNKNNNEQKVSLIFQLNIDYKTIFSARGIVFVRSAF